MKRLALVAAALVSLSGCTGPHGQVDYAKTAILGVGVGGAVALLGGALNDQSGSRGHGGGYGRGYQQQYRPQYYGGGGGGSYGYGGSRGYSGFGF